MRYFQGKLTVKVIALLFIVITVFMIPAVWLVWKNQMESINNQARARAVTLFQMIVLTRQWVSDNRERIEPVPAEATKELSEYADYMADFRFRITSDQLVNPENAPSPFEERAMKAIKSGAPEYSERGYYEGIEGETYQYAAPLFINDSCMKCHAVQGYEVNQFRGVISVIIPLKDLEIAMHNNNITLISAVVAGLVIVSSILSLLIYRMVLSPIGILTTAAAKLRTGEYSVNIKKAIKGKQFLTSTDEIDELSEAFDEMSTQIARNEEELKAKLSEAVAKYVELVNELSEKNTQLGTLNQLKTDLLDSIAHEIRTPLTKILSYSELLGDERLLNEEKARFLTALKRNISSISNMFNDIITMSRLEHGQYVYHRIPLALKEVVEKILEMNASDIELKKLSINVNIKDDDRVSVDGESFYYALSNIISNALKYSHINGVIDISLTFKEKSDVVITVSDTGVGIPKDEINGVFSRFRRGSNVKNEYPGTGLGLAIAERVVKEHNGAIFIESEIGKRTTVTIVLNNCLQVD